MKDTSMFQDESVQGTPYCFAKHSAVAIGKKIYTYGGFDGHSILYQLGVTSFHICIVHY